MRKHERILFTEAVLDNLDEDRVLLPLEFILKVGFPEWVEAKQICIGHFDILIDNFPDFADFIIQSCERRGVLIPSEITFEFHHSEDLPMCVPQYIHPPDKNPLTLVQ